MGVPSSPDGMLALLDAVNSAADELDAPVVVHCTAGVGRTGTFIAVDLAISRLQLGGCVDLIDTVAAVRGCRAGSVQTREQLQFVHACVLQAHAEIEDAKRRPQAAAAAPAAPPPWLHPSGTSLGRSESLVMASGHDGAWCVVPRRPALQEHLLLRREGGELVTRWITGAGVSGGLLLDGEEYGECGTLEALVEALEDPDDYDTFCDPLRPELAVPYAAAPEPSGGAGGGGIEGWGIRRGLSFTGKRSGDRPVSIALQQGWGEDVAAEAHRLLDKLLAGQLGRAAFDGELDLLFDVEAEV